MSKRALALAKRYGKKTDIIEIYKEIMEEKRRNGELVEDTTESAYRITAFPKKNSVGEAVYKDYSIITNDEQIRVMKWGLVPHWLKAQGQSEQTIQKAEQIRLSTLNARAETLFEKPSFRTPIIRSRCIIPSTGYFEYRHNEDGSKTPYFIFCSDSDLFSMGGVWDQWIHPVTHEVIDTFSLITTEANRLTGKIHNGGKNPRRMPLILSPEDELRWLDSTLKKAEIEGLLKPFGEKGMDAYPVKESFIHMELHDPAIIERVA
ncbi:SOS response-associated peptidase [Parabacteroides sp. OttesenSCG-928-K15]|nr:SOS response-associated peptidase [Parabacteroides sp. OttesenSCG-928-K15]